MSGWQLKELIGVVALVVAIVALFKDPIMAYVFRPRLHIEFDQTNGADFHRIPVNFVANSGELVGQVPSYYARLRVRNTKGSTAQMVEVSVISLSRRDLSGTYVPIGTFLPLNLKWSHVGTTHRERIPRTVTKYCDLLHMLQPGLPNSPASLLAELDLEVQPSSGTGILAPGFYKLVVQVAAGNASAKNTNVYLCVREAWADTAAGMIANGFYLTI